MRFRCPLRLVRELSFSEALPGSGTTSCCFSSSRARSARSDWFSFDTSGERSLKSCNRSLPKASISALEATLFSTCGPCSGFIIHHLLDNHHVGFLPLLLTDGYEYRSMPPLRRI